MAQFEVPKGGGSKDYAKRAEQKGIKPALRFPNRQPDKAELRGQYPLNGVVRVS